MIDWILQLLHKLIEGLKISIRENFYWGLCFAALGIIFFSMFVYTFSNSRIAPVISAALFTAGTAFVGTISVVFISNILKDRRKLKIIGKFRESLSSQLNNQDEKTKSDIYQYSLELFKESIK